MTELRPLGVSSLVVAPIALGCMNFGGPTPPEEAEAILDHARGVGVSLYDTADVYLQGRSEEVLGAWMASRACRDEVVVATKVGMPTRAGAPGEFFDPAHITASCEGSLRRLGVDVIDLYQLHRPPLPDGARHDDVLEALHGLVVAGKVRYLGCSTHPAWLVVEADRLVRERGWTAYVSEQPPYNLLDRRIERELVPVAERYGLGLLPWSPLGGGILAGRYDRGIDDASRAARKPQVATRITPAAVEVAADLAEVAAGAGVTSAQLALHWCRDQPGITAPLIGPRTLDQAIEQLAVLAWDALDRELVARCDELVAPGAAVSDFHNNAYW